MITSYIAFVAVSLVLFVRLPTQTAGLIAYMSGLLFLPVASFPANTITSESFTVDVIGIALPSNLGLTKAAIVPFTTLCFVTAFSPQRWRQLRPNWPDVAVVLFCFWPLLGLFAEGTQANLLFWQAAYLCGVWGSTWLLARLLLQDEADQRLLVRIIAWSGVALLPFSILEGIRPPWVYNLIYGSHPFQIEGAPRYLGFRPMAFFEHGNQFGIWMALSALAWIAVVYRSNSRTPMMLVCTIAVVLAAVASQSGGAIVLLVMGVLWLSLRRQTVKLLIRSMSLATVLLGSVYFSGSLPVARSAWEATVGPKVMHVLKASGRGSIGYRIRRDQMSLPMIRKAPIAGYGRWDWWRPLGSHPWGWPLLQAGQFGVISLFLAGMFLFGAAGKRLWQGSRAVLPIIIVLAGVDSWLNSYIFFPAILAAGALASRKAEV